MPVKKVHLHSYLVKIVARKLVSYALSSQQKFDIYLYIKSCICIKVSCKAI